LFLLGWSLPLGIVFSLIAFLIRISLDNIYATCISTKRAVDLYIFDLLIFKTITLLTKLLAVGGLVRIIVRCSSRDQDQGLNKSISRVIAGIINTCICYKNNKGFVCLIGYFLVVYTNAEIILGLVKILETNN
jgi:hypothetical protein